MNVWLITVAVSKFVSIRLVVTNVNARPVLFYILIRKTAKKRQRFVNSSLFLFLYNFSYQCITSLPVTEKTEEIASPGFETGQYKVHSNCTWNLSITQGHRIRLRWQTFELEHHPEVSYSRLGKAEFMDLIPRENL